MPIYLGAEQKKQYDEALDESLQKILEAINREYERRICSVCHNPLAIHSEYEIEVCKVLSYLPKFS
jgi:RNase P subunit RPR2